MTIKFLRAYTRNLALTRPYTIAYQTTTSVENVFLEVELSNGMVGIGAANPDPDVVGESPANVLRNLQSDAVQCLVGRDIRTFQGLIDTVQQQFPNAPGTLAALDIALHDAFGQYLGVPVVAFYGQHLDALPTSVTIGIMNVTDTLREAAEYYARGFRVLKVKTGLSADEDSERVLRLREVYGPSVTIRVDANQGYELADLQQFLTQTESANVELIEQPLPVGQEAQLLALPNATRQILVADESLKGPEAALWLSQPPRPFGVFNIKLMKCGGIRSAMHLATIARYGQLSLFWGCNDESRVSITAALHAAFANPHTRYLDLDGHLDLAEDIVLGGFVLENGIMRIAEGNGLGLHRLY